MSNATKVPAPGKPRTANEASFIFHASFEDSDAARMYGTNPAHQDHESLNFMADEITRDLTKRMHYAAWRAQACTNLRAVKRWNRAYYDYRDRIVLGNRKLTFRAVQKWGCVSQLAEDMAGECQIVLIKAVAAFNPWLGIRFSTYAFTCLMRALSRLTQRQAADRLARSLPLDSLPYGEPSYMDREEIPTPRLSRLGEFLRETDPLLTSREKLVLSRRFHLNDEVSRTETLEQVGNDLGLSKERVRQIQNSALAKLREAILSRTSLS